MGPGVRVLYGLRSPPAYGRSRARSPGGPFPGLPGARRAGSLSSVPRLSDVISELDALWPPERAEGWDAVGTVCGDPDAEIHRVLFAVDPVREVVDEAKALGAQLVVTHHPLYLRGTTTVAADTFKGRVVHTLIRDGIALHVAHTNADTADPGVSDALAAALDLRVERPSCRTRRTRPGAADSAGSACSTTPRPSARSPPAPPPGCPPPHRASASRATRTRSCAPSR